MVAKTQYQDLSFNVLRDAIVARLERAMPKEVYVTTHPGTVDEGEIARVCVRAPALLVSVLDVAGLDRKRGQTAAELRLGVYLVATPGKRGQAADDIALAILPRALAVIDGEDWNLEDVETRPVDLKADNLYSGRLGNVGLLALWGISWRQRVLMPDLRDFSEPANRPDETDMGLPWPWNDPLADFLRAALDMTEADSGLHTDDVFGVRTGEPVNSETNP